MVKGLGVAVIFLSSSLLFETSAQTGVATLSGRVTDASAAAVPGASLKVRNLETNEERAASSGEQGDYTIANLAPGNYEVAIEKPGFHRLVQSGVTLQVDQAARLDFTLQVGNLSETVEVTAEIPLLNTDNPSKGEVITGQEIVEMPLDGRDFADLAFLVPGVQRRAQGGQGSAFSINGARGDNNNFIIDGFNNLNPRGGGAQARPNIDAMQEFKLQTTGYSAEHGRMAGGVMNMALKTGGNQFHGTAFEFLRNDAMDARDFFDARKSKLRRNQFGATLNGPVMLPKLYNGRDRTFFLFSWESYRQSVGTNRLGIVPEERERQGDFSRTVDATTDKPVVLVDPYAAGTCVEGMRGGCFPGNVIPASRYHRVVQYVLPYWPLPNRPGQPNNYATNASDTDVWDSFVVKADQRFAGNHSLSVRLLRRGNVNSEPFAGSNLGTFGDTNDNPQTLGGVTYTHMATPTLIAEFRAGFSRTRTNRRNNNLGRDFAGEFGIPGVISDPRLTGFPRFTVRDHMAIGDAANVPLRWSAMNYQTGATATWVRGPHLLKFGADILRTHSNDSVLVNNIRGTFNYLGRATNAPFADFLLGLPQSTSRLVSRTPAYLRATIYGFFVQDDWKARPNLTLNLGLRWDIMKPPLEKYDRMSNFLPEEVKIVVADDRAIPDLQELIDATNLRGKVGFARDYNLPRSLVYTRYTNFAPRVGFAWRPRNNNRHVVRMGYGIFFGASMTDPIRADLTSAYPFTISQTFSRNANNPDALTMTDPFPAPRAAIEGVNNAAGYEVRAPSQYLQSWNFTYEREFGRQSALELAYVGSKGTHLGRRYDINQPFRDPALRPSGTGNFPRPYTGINTINYYSFGSNSVYWAGIASFRKRTRGGLFVRINYTYSKSIDDASQISGNANGGYPGAQDSRNLKLERARSDWDNGHAVTTNFVYEVRVWRRNRFLRNWQMAGTGRFYTGQPFTPRTSNVDLNLGDANRPDRIAKGRVANGTPERWFDVSAFPMVPRGTFRFGNSGRNVLDGPGYAAMNASLSRRFRLSETHTLQFRGEVFNVTNHTNLQLPEGMVNAANGGTITRSNPARVTQLGLKYLF